MKRGVVCLVALVLLAAGCAGTFTTVTPGTGAPPAPPPRALLIGPVQAVDPAWEPHVAYFRKGLTGWLAKNGGLQVADSAAAASGDTVVLVGTITEVHKGNRALRLLVGLGAGQARAAGDFELRRPDGGVLKRFTAQRSYLGGLGIGGMDFLDMDDLVARLGETVAETTLKWARGESTD